MVANVSLGQIVKEACGDRSEMIQQQNLFDMDATIGDVVDEDEAIRQLGKPWIMP